MKTPRRFAFTPKRLIALSIAVVALLAAGFGLLGALSGAFSLTAASVTTTPVDDGQADSETAPGITEERAVELAVQYGRSWGLKEFTGVYDIGMMKMLDFYALRGDEPTPGQSGVWQNTVWVVSLEGLREECSPPDFYGKLHCGESDNMYVVLDAASGRVYSWGSRVAGPLTIPR